MKKYLAIILAVLVAAACFTGCGTKQSSQADEDEIKAILTNVEEEQEELETLETPSTVYLNSTRAGAITKAANPVVGINFDLIDDNYTITKTRSNFMVDPIYGGGEPFYVMFDSPDEIVIGDFEYGFATAISTKWEDLIHIYDLENELVYKVVTPLDTNRIKKVGDNKFAIQCGSTADGYKSYSFSTSEKYAYDLFENDDDVVMIVDGGHEYDVAIELAQESEGATTEAADTTEEAESPEASSNGKETVAADSSEHITENAEKDTSVPAEVTDDTEEPEVPSDEETEETIVPETVAEEASSAETEEELKADAKEVSDTDQIVPEETVSEQNEASSETADESTETVVSEETESVDDTAGEVSEEVLQEESEPEETAGAEEAEEEIETTVVRTANDAIPVELSEEEVSEENDAEAQADGVPLHTDIPGGRIINVPAMSQFPYYPSGCESVSTVMALHYHGVDLSVDDFINRYLDMSNDFYIQDGLKYGPSPEQYFIGTPYDNSGFGCLATVIYNALLKIYDYDLSKVENASGLSMENLCLDYINHDLPVMVWVNIGMIDSFESNTWHLEDGSEYVWKGQEHCMLLVGYDQYNYYFNDPYTGEVLTYEKALSQRCYEQQGMQAVVILN